MRSSYGVVILTLLSTSCAAVDEPCPARLTLTAGDQRAQVCAEIADTESARVQGLRGRQALPADEALLLVFVAEDEVCLTSDGVSFDIDAFYVDGVGTITAVERGIPAGDAAPRCHPATDRKSVV